jgi:hypothetical protein
MVSPPYKGGYGVNPNRFGGVAVSGPEEGDSAQFASVGVFAGEPNNNPVQFNTYIARRYTTGWFTGPLTLAASSSTAASLSDILPTFESSLFSSLLGPNSGTAGNDTETELLAHSLARLEAPFELVGTPIKRLDGRPIAVSPVGASTDFCHVLFINAVTGLELAEAALLPEAIKTFSILYELAAGQTRAGCGDEPPSLRLVGVTNELGSQHEPKVIDPYCLDFLGASDPKEGNGFNAISADGSEIFFSTNAEPAKGEQCDGEFNMPTNPTVLYVRLDGERTVEVSKPIAADCEASAPCNSAPRARAMFVGASEDGTRAFFVTKQPLVTSDVDNGRDVYMARIGCPAAKAECQAAEREVTSLVQVSRSPVGGEAAVQGVSVVSADGGRVYFVARGVLTSGPNAEGQMPVQGADNMYVYDAQEGAEGGMKFIADLCSGPERSGETGDLHCPANLETGGEGRAHSRNDISLWLGSYRELQTTSDGRFLVFASYAQLITSGPQADTDTAKDVYRYDAQTGLLDRVSIGQAGHDANGNNDLFNAELPQLDHGGLLTQDYETNYRAISEDGSRIVFSTAEPLSAAAVNGLENAYEWHKEAGASEGTVSLVSSGSDEQPVGQTKTLVITPSGRDIFFITVQGLSEQDTDGANDLYDARLGPGFPPPTAGRQPCAGDACQGPLTDPAPVLIPGSVSQTAGENLQPKSAKHTKPKKPRRRPKRRPKSKRASRARRAVKHRTGRRRR